MDPGKRWCPQHGEYTMTTFNCGCPFCLYKQDRYGAPKLWKASPCPACGVPVQPGYEAVHRDTCHPRKEG